MARPGTGAGTIDLVGVAKTYVGGTVALRQVDLHVDRGEIVALLGPSGAGKSTLLRCMNGLVRPTTGQVQVDGLTVDGEESTLRRVRQRAAMIFQQFNLVGRLSALENVLTARLSYRPVLPTLFRRFPPEDYERAVRCLRRVGLAERAGQRADTLSGGERQRVAVARALAQEPAILLADEPVASLDPRSTHQVLELIRRVSREDGLTVLMSLHQVELARQFSDRVAGLASGREGKVTRGALRVIWVSKLIPNDPVVVRKDLPPSLKTAIEESLVSMKDRAPEAFANAGAVFGGGFVQADDTKYQIVREMNETAKKLAAQK